MAEERFVIRANDDISQNGDWEVRSVALGRATGCRYCCDTGTMTEVDEPCYMCKVNNWVANFAEREDAELFVRSKGVK